MQIFRTLLLSVFVALFTFGAGHAAANTDEAPYTEASVTEALNAVRAKQDLPKLTINPILSFVAQEKAHDMIAQNYFAHSSTIHVPLWNWLTEAGYVYRAAGENLARGYTSKTSLISAWTHSPIHRANILNAQYTETGIAVTQGKQNGRNVWYVVQVFGTQVP